MTTVARLFPLLAWASIQLTCVRRVRGPDHLVRVSLNRRKVTDIIVALVLPKSGVRCLNNSCGVVDFWLD